MLRRLTVEPRGYWIGFVTNAATVSASIFLLPHARLEHLMILYLLGPVLIATRYGVAVSAATTLSSVLLFDYVCVPPRFAFAFPDTHSVVTLLGMLLVALMMSALLHRLRYQRTVARASEERTRALCELSLDLSDVTEAANLPTAAERHLSALFGSGALVLLRGSDGNVDFSRLLPHENGAALAALGSGQLSFCSSGPTTAFQPIRSRSETLGLVRVALSEGPAAASAEQRILLAACADRIAASVERAALGEAARKAKVEAEAERLRSELLSAVSHDLKTPLASILTAGTALLDRGVEAAPASRELLATIVEETERLNALVTNLLSATRLEAGTVRLNRAFEALDELIFGVLSRLSLRLEGRAVDVRIPSDLPLVEVDAVLIDQLLVNLIENVLKYTPAGSPIDVRVESQSAALVLRVEDRGPGIGADERERVFDKFYRGRKGRLNDGGSGLGLTICRAIARAHDGTIHVEARPGGGAAVICSLPVCRDATPSRARQPELSL